MIPFPRLSKVPEITLDDVVRVLDAHRPLWVGEFCSGSDAADLARGYVKREQLKTRLTNDMVSTVARAVIVAMQLKEAEHGSGQGS